MNIGEQIRKYRKEAGLSQKELGEKLGVTQQHIAQYENGKRIPKLETINNIAGALGIGVRRLYPEFSHEEWQKTDTYKQSKNRYDTAIRGISAILSYKYENIEEKYSNNYYHYTISKDGKNEDINPIVLDLMLKSLKDITPALYEMIKETASIEASLNLSKKSLKDNDKKEED